METSVAFLQEFVRTLFICTKVVVAAMLFISALSLSLALAASATDGYGAYDPVFTPFNVDGSLRLDVIPAYAKYTTQKGTAAIILGGSTGEWPSMTSDERIAVLKAWRAALDSLDPAISPHHRIPQLIFHAGDTALERAIGLATAARDIKADGILIVAPCIMKPTTLDMLVKVIGMVASAAGPTMPAWYYHYPALYGVDFPMHQFLDRVDKTGAIENLVGVKYIDGNLTEFALATKVGGGKYKLVSTHLLEGLAAGSSGAIGYTPQGPFADAMFAAHEAGNATATRVAAERYALLGRILSSDKSQVRASSRIFVPHLDLGPPRLPLTDVDEATVDQMRRSLKEHAFL